VFSSASTSAACRTRNSRRGKPRTARWTRSRHMTREYNLSGSRSQRLQGAQVTANSCRCWRSATAGRLHRRRGQPGGPRRSSSRARCGTPLSFDGVPAWRHAHAGRRSYAVVGVLSLASVSGGHGCHLLAPLPCRQSGLVGRRLRSSPCGTSQDRIRIEQVKAELSVISRRVDAMFTRCSEFPGRVDRAGCSLQEALYGKAQPVLFVLAGRSFSSS